MKVGYIRTSKKDQNPELQRKELLAAGCEKLFEEQISSRKADRPELRAALEYVREGDALVVWKLDRFGRSLRGDQMALGCRRTNVSTGFVPSGRR